VKKPTDKKTFTAQIWHNSKLTFSLQLPYEQPDGLAILWLSLIQLTGGTILQPVD
jgi:hypothetical protein